MENKAKRILNLSADKVNGYVFKGAPEGWSWWHVLATVAFVVLLVFALCSPMRAHAATFPKGEHLQCRITVYVQDSLLTPYFFKAYGANDIAEVHDDKLVMFADNDMPRVNISLPSGALFGYSKTGRMTYYKGVCRNQPDIQVIK